MDRNKQASEGQERTTPQFNPGRPQTPDCFLVLEGLFGIPMLKGLAIEVFNGASGRGIAYNSVESCCEVEMSESELLTVRESLAITGFSKDRTYQKIRAGEMPGVRMGPRGIRIPRRALEEWIKSLSESALANCK